MPEQADQTSEVLTPREVAELLEVDVSTVRRWIVAGYLPAAQLPGLKPRYRVMRADAEAKRPQLVRSAI